MGTGIGCEGSGRVSWSAASGARVSCRREWGRGRGRGHQPPTCGAGAEQMGSWGRQVQATLSSGQPSEKGLQSQDSRDEEEKEKPVKRSEGGGERGCRKLQAEY